jgi:hypothetical protein
MHTCTCKDGARVGNTDADRNRVDNDELDACQEQVREGWEGVDVGY